MIYSASAITPFYFPQTPKGKSSCECSIKIKEGGENLIVMKSIKKNLGELRVQNRIQDLFKPYIIASLKQSNLENVILLNDMQVRPIKLCQMPFPYLSNLHQHLLCRFDARRCPTSAPMNFSKAKQYDYHKYN